MNTKTSSTSNASGEARLQRAFDLWWKASLLILLAFAILLLAWARFYTHAARSTGHQFVKALKTGDTKRAFELCTPALQRSLGGEDQLQQIVAKSNAVHDPWFWTSGSVRGDVTTLQFSSKKSIIGDGWTVRLKLDKIGNDWRVSQYDSSNSSGAVLRLTTER